MGTCHQRQKTFPREETILYFFVCHSLRTKAASRKEGGLSDKDEEKKEDRNPDTPLRLIYHEDAAQERKDAVT